MLPSLGPGDAEPMDTALQSSHRCHGDTLMAARLICAFATCVIWAVPTHAEAYTFTLTFSPDQATYLPRVTATGKVRYASQAKEVGNTLTRSSA